jgi:hypothetical protein
MLWVNPKGSEKKGAKKGAKRRLEERSALDLVAILAGGELLDVLAVLGGHEGLGNAEKRTHKISQDCIFYIYIKAYRT